MQVDRAAAQDRDKLRHEDNPRGTMSPHGPEEGRAKQAPQLQQKIGQQKDQGLQQPQQQQAGQVRAGATAETFKQQGQQAQRSAPGGSAGAAGHEARSAADRTAAIDAAGKIV